MDDSYGVGEDETLVIDASSPNRLLDNDIGVSNTLLPTRLLVTTEPQFGTLTITDELTGEFTYTPFEGVTGPTVGFDGTDTFIYRLLTQGNATDAGSSEIRFATVTSISSARTILRRSMSRPSLTCSKTRRPRRLTTS